jgi:putative inorganic carbon (hco3(-)) transporter
VAIALLDILFVGIVVAAFAFGLRTGVATIIFVRPLTDRLFELAGFDVAGHHVTYGVMINIIVLCALVINITKVRSCTPSGLRYLWMPFLIVCVVATLYSPLPIDAVRRISIYGCYYAMFVLAFAVVKSERDIPRLLKFVVLSSVLPVLYGLFQTVSGFDRYVYDSRIQSTFSHPNMFAFYLLAVIGTVCFLLTTDRIAIAGRWRLLLTLYLIPLLIALVMTQTRSAWIGCIVLFLAYGLLRDRRVLALLLIAAPLALAIPAVNERIASLMSENDYIGGSAIFLNSYAWRKLLWDNAFIFIWQRPIFGYGLHSFPYYSPQFFPAAPGTYAHNDYLAVLFETGLVGLVTFLWIFWGYAVWLFQRWRFDKGGATTAAAMLATYMICSYSDNLLEYLPYQWEFWFPLGVICWHLERQRLLARLDSQSLSSSSPISTETAELPAGSASIRRALRREV